MSSSPCASAAAWARRGCSKCYRRGTESSKEPAMLIPISLAILVPILLVLLVTALKSFGINQEYQRGVLFRLGRLGNMKGPGWYWLIPFVDRVVRVDLRIITYQLETQ